MDAMPSTRKPAKNADATASSQGAKGGQRDLARKKATVRRPGGGTILLLGVVIIAIAMLSPTVNQLIQQRQRIADLEQTISDTQADITALETERARWDDPAFIKQQARGRLLLVEPGDTTYIVVDSGPADVPLPPEDVSVDQHATKNDSAELFLGTLIQSAGANTAPESSPEHSAPATTPAPTDAHATIEESTAP